MGQGGDDRGTPARGQPAFEVRRVYDGDVPGYRVLVDRLWPRGMAKDTAPLDEWLKDAAPSSELRRWYGHEPAKFAEFARRYRVELGRPPASDAVTHLRGLGRRRVVLMTATRDVAHSGAEVLMDHLVTGAT
jgi:uncharacterized protein YeaO (DUF488 family)